MKPTPDEKFIYGLFAAIAVLYLISLIGIGVKIYERGKCLYHPATLQCSGINGFLQ